MDTDLRVSRVPPLILVVVDQPELAEVVLPALRHAHFHARLVPGVEEAEVALAASRPNFTIVDVDAENGAILDRLGATSAGEDKIPVLSLTRQHDLKTRLAAFEHGVDDILTIPFSPEELIARVLAIMRRTYHAAVPFTSVLRVGEVEIDILHHSVRLGDDDLHLTSLERSLLYLLAANAGRLVTRDEIQDYLWGDDYVAESNVVDRHVRNLRAKLRDDWHQPRYIATVPGKGYWFVPASVN